MGTTSEQAENSKAAGEQQAISIITNYNVQQTLGPSRPISPGGPRGPWIPWTERDIGGGKERKKDGRGRTREEERERERDTETYTALWAECDTVRDSLVRRH